MSAKQIRDKIKTIKSTRKITKAMEMVAASKMRKAQQRMQASRPYSARVKEVISHLIHGRLEFEHPFLDIRTIKKAGFIVVSSDRGLCGGLNTNLFKQVLLKVTELQEKNIKADFCTLGKKAGAFFKGKSDINIIASKDNLGDVPSIKDVIGPVKVVLDSYIYTNLDAVYLCYNSFINTMKQEPKIEQLLPLCSKEDFKSSKYSWDYIYEPNSYKLLEDLMQRYIESVVYQSLVENIASEQSSRMVAMKSATDNAGEIISDLLLEYNKARQAAITKELSEIVGGAAAV